MNAPRSCKVCGADGPFSTYVVRGKTYPRAECVPCLNVKQAKQARDRRALRKSPKLPESATPPIHATTPQVVPAHAAIRTIVVASDVHIPEHDRGAWGVFLAVLRLAKPDEVILAGDYGEWESVSSHASSNENALMEDVVAVRRSLNEIRDAVGEGARITYLEGNHETRLTRAISQRAPSLKGALTIPELLDLDDRAIEWVPEGRQPIDRGLLRVLHGHQVFGQGAGGIYHSRKAADTYANDAGRVVTYGHTHKPQQFHRAVYRGTGRAVGLGCLRTIAPSEVGWLHGNESGWAHGFAVFSVLAASVHVEEVRPIRGQAMFRGVLVDGGSHAAG